VGVEPLEQLSESECWSLLRTVEIGRLAAPTSDGGVEIMPVNHVVDQGSIVFRSALGTKLTVALEAPEVAFEADNAADRIADQRDDPWSVVLRGAAELIERPTDVFDSFELSVTPWHESPKPYFVRLSPHTISGRRFRLEPTQ
jgi:uncharacterized protein